MSACRCDAGACPAPACTAHRSAAQRGVAQQAAGPTGWKLATSPTAAAASIVHSSSMAAAKSPCEPGPEVLSSGQMFRAPLPAAWPRGEGGRPAKLPLGQPRPLQGSTGQWRPSPSLPPGPAPSCPRPYESTPAARPPPRPWLRGSAASAWPTGGGTPRPAHHAIWVPSIEGVPAQQLPSVVPKIGAGRDGRRRKGAVAAHVPRGPHAHAARRRRRARGGHAGLHIQPPPALQWCVDQRSGKHRTMPGVTAGQGNGHDSFLRAKAI